MFKFPNFTRKQKAFDVIEVSEVIIEDGKIFQERQGTGHFEGMKFKEQSDLSTAHATTVATIDTLQKELDDIKLHIAQHVTEIQAHDEDYDKPLEMAKLSHLAFGIGKARAMVANGFSQSGL